MPDKTCFWELCVPKKCHHVKPVLCKCSLVKFTASAVVDRSYKHGLLKIDKQKRLYTAQGRVIKGAITRLQLLLKIKELQKQGLKPGEFAYDFDKKPEASLKQLKKDIRAIKKTIDTVGLNIDRDKIRKEIRLIQSSSKEQSKIIKEIIGIDFSGYTLAPYPEAYECPCEAKKVIMLQKLWMEIKAIDKEVDQLSEQAETNWFSVLATLVFDVIANIYGFAVSGLSTLLTVKTFKWEFVDAILDLIGATKGIISLLTEYLTKESLEWEIMNLKRARLRKKFEYYLLVNTRTCSKKGGLKVSSRDLRRIEKETYVMLHPTEADMPARPKRGFLRSFLRRRNRMRSTNHAELH